MPSKPPAEITLALSASAGIVAVAHGERYRWAQTALKRVGFQRRDDGTFALAVNNPQTARDAVHQLIPTARRHQATVTASNRRYLGDVADEIATHLPGTWSAKVEVYSHPLWQHDLLPWLWDAGELIHAVQTERLPYTAILTEDTGIELLLTERPDTNTTTCSAPSPRTASTNTSHRRARRAASSCPPPPSRPPTRSPTGSCPPTTTPFTPGAGPPSPSHSSGSARSTTPGRRPRSPAASATAAP
jgi:hypothetical protein